MMMSRLEEIKCNLRQALESCDEDVPEEDIELGALIMLSIDPGDYTYGDYYAIAHETRGSGCGDLLYGMNEAGYFPEYEASDVKEWLNTKDESCRLNFLETVGCLEEELEDRDYTEWVELNDGIYRDFIRWFVTKEE